MDNDNVQSEPRTPSLREELEGLVRSIFTTTDAPSTAKMIPPPPRVQDAEVPVSAKADGKPDAAEQVAVMLRDLFEAQDTFVISNAGVQEIIDGLLRRYRERESPVLRERLLAHWRKDVPRLRAALVEASKDDPLVLDTGQEVSLVTTQKAQALLDRFCPQSAYLPETRVTRDVR